MAGMWIAHIDVHDEERYAEYVKGSSKVIPGYDGEFIARGGRYRQVEGRDYPRNVLVRFPTYERAMEAYESEEYQAILGTALAASERMLTIIEVDD
ncbi:MAG: DUF1330 domain-containing protein [Acidimicrobiia bacterium]|jgi:uncharacterized protein (DUF1330 family)